MTRLIAIFAVLVLAAAFASSATVRADGHENNRLKHDLEKQQEGKGKKAGADLTLLYQEYQEYVEREGTGEGFEPSNPLIRLVADRVIIEAVADGRADDLDKDLQGLGLKKGKAKGRLVSGQLPLANIKKLNGVGRLKFARPSYVMTASGLVTSQGDAAMRAGVARAASGVDGTGVVVGALSDSFDCRGGAAGDVGTGDLPAGIVVLDDETGCGSGTDEGRAMMQLIHDVAPGAGQAFHTAFNSQTDFADGIVELATVAGADVIVDDVIYFLEPMFQDGIVAQAVGTVEGLGVSYFSSAGNNGRDSYQSSYRSSGISLVSAGADAHDFNPGPDTDLFQRITVRPGSGFILVFQWDEPYASVSGPPGSASDVDIFITDDPPTRVITGSAAGNIGGDPAEIFVFFNPSNSSDSTFNMVIEKFTGPGPGLMKYIRFDLGSGVVINEYDTKSGTVYGHANAAGAEAVGAAFYGDTPEFGVSPPLLEGFSSAGVTPILFDTNGARKSAPELRQKPGIVAPDGTNNTFLGQDISFDSDSFPNFFGTSAAAPHAAAVAALMLDMDPTLTPGDLFGALRTTAIDMNGAGVDFDSGYGFIQADLAVAAVTPNLPPAGQGDTAITSEEAFIIIDVLGNDLDPDGNLDPATVTVTLGPNHGITSVNPATGLITYTPEIDFNGSDSFAYTVADDDGDTAPPQTVSVTVHPINDPPVAVFDPMPPLDLTEGSSADILLDSLITDVETDLDQIGWASVTSDSNVATVLIGGVPRVATITGVDDGTVTITLTATDNGDPHGCSGGPPQCSSSASIDLMVSVTASNLPPSVDAGPDGDVIAGEQFDLSPVTFTDLGKLDTHKASVDWGDGGPDQDLDSVSSPFGVSHTYLEAGTYTVTVTVVDDDLGAGSDAIIVTVTPAAPTGVSAVVDIRPRSINLNSRGLTPVAVVANDAFDANDVDIGTLRFGFSGATAIAAHVGHIEELNGDGLEDIMLHFWTAALGIPLDTDDGEVLLLDLTGSLLNGAELTGQAYAQIKVKRLARPAPTVVPPTPGGPVKGKTENSGGAKDKSGKGSGAGNVGGNTGSGNGEDSPGNPAQGQGQGGNGNGNGNSNEGNNGNGGGNSNEGNNGNGGGNSNEGNNGNGGGNANEGNGGGNANEGNGGGGNSNEGNGGGGNSNEGNGGGGNSNEGNGGGNSNEGNGGGSSNEGNGGGNSNEGNGGGSSNEGNGGGSSNEGNGGGNSNEGNGGGSSNEGNGGGNSNEGNGNGNGNPGASDKGNGGGTQDKG